MTRNILRTLKAFRLKPAPGIHAGRFLTVLGEDGSESVAFSLEAADERRRIQRTYREEVYDHRTRTACAHSFLGGFANERDILVSEGVHAMSVCDIHDDSGRPSAGKYTRVVVVRRQRSPQRVKIFTRENVLVPIDVGQKIRGGGEEVG